MLTAPRRMGPPQIHCLSSHVPSCTFWSVIMPSYMCTCLVACCIRVFFAPCVSGILLYPCELFRVKSTHQQSRVSLSQLVTFYRFLITISFFYSPSGSKYQFEAKMATHGTGKWIRTGRCPTNQHLPVSFHENVRMGANV